MEQYSNDPQDTSIEEAAANRQNTRDSLFLMADFRVTGAAESNQVRVRNLSSGGLMAECPEGLESGLAVEFKLRGIGWVPGKVAWAAAGRLGIAFDRAIDPMLARKPVGQGTTTPVFTKPVLPRKNF